MIARSTQRYEDRGAAAQFRELALPLLDDVYTLARYLLGSGADADDAVQECYLRAFRHFDTYHGPAIKPWLFTILRNVCNAEFARRSKSKLRNTEADAETLEDTAPLWQEVRDTPQTALLRELDAATIRRLVRRCNFGDQGTEIKVEAAIEGALARVAVDRRKNEAGDGQNYHHPGGR